MATIKRALVLSSLVLFASSTLLAETEAPRRFSNRLLNDVVQMTRAGLQESTIIAYVKARRSRLDADVSADDLIQLRRAGVSEDVVRYIGGAVNLQTPEGSDREVAYQSEGGSTSSVAPVDAEDYAIDGPYASGYGWYPYGYPYWYAYSPYFATEVFLGGGGFRGRGFIHRGHGGGHFQGGGHFRGGGHGGGHRGGRR